MGCHHQHTAGLSTELVTGFLRYGPVSTFERHFFFSFLSFSHFLAVLFLVFRFFSNSESEGERKSGGKRIDGEFLGKVEQEREKKKIPSFLLIVFFPSFHLFSPSALLGEGECDSEGSDIALP